MDLCDSIYGPVLMNVKNFVRSCMNLFNVFCMDLLKILLGYLWECVQNFTVSIKKSIQNTILYNNILRSVWKDVKNFFNSFSWCGNWQDFVITIWKKSGTFLQNYLTNLDALKGFGRFAIRSWRQNIQRKSGLAWWRLRPAMAWRQATMRPGRPRGSSGQTHCGSLVDRPPSKKKKKRQQKKNIGDLLW
jgi:hypothetical protein